jgi:AraC-like DNA-binding protein
MKHCSSAQIEYGCVDGLAGVETLRATKLAVQFDRHFHDSYSFGLILSGVETCSVQRCQHFFEPGMVPMFNPGDVHDGGPATEDGWSYRMVYAYRMVYVDPSLVEDERAFPRTARRDTVARECVGQLFDALDCGSLLGIDESLQAALDSLLERREAPAASPRLERVRERIDVECSQPLRLRDLGAMVGVSPTRLLRAFQAAYGLTPHRYQQSRRIARAKRMMLQGMPLAEVAAACGYADQTHMNRWFFRIHATTSGRFRSAFFS